MVIIYTDIFIFLRQYSIYIKDTGTSQFRERQTIVVSQYEQGLVTGSTRRQTPVVSQYARCKQRKRRATLIVRKLRYFILAKLTVINELGG